MFVLILLMVYLDIILFMFALSSGVKTIDQLLSEGKLTIGNDLLFIVLAVVAVVLAVLLLRKIIQILKKRQFGKGLRIVLIVFAACIGVACLVGVVSGQNYRRNTRNLGEVPASFYLNGELPENPRYMVYLRDGEHLTDKPHGYPKGYVTDIRKANVLVVLDRYSTPIGDWYDHSGHNYIAPASREIIRASVVRLDDWCVIAEERFEGNNLDNYKYTINYYDDDIIRWLEKVLHP